MTEDPIGKEIIGGTPIQAVEGDTDFAISTTIVLTAPIAFQIADTSTVWAVSITGLDMAAVIDLDIPVIAAMLVQATSRGSVTASFTVVPPVWMSATLVGVSSLTHPDMHLAVIRLSSIAVGFGSLRQPALQTQVISLAGSMRGIGTLRVVGSLQTQVILLSAVTSSSGSAQGELSVPVIRITANLEGKGQLVADFYRLRVDTLSARVISSGSITTSMSVSVLPLRAGLYGDFSITADLFIPVVPLYANPIGWTSLDAEMTGGVTPVSVVVGTVGSIYPAAGISLALPPDAHEYDYAVISIVQYCGGTMAAFVDPVYATLLVETQPTSVNTYPVRVYSYRLTYGDIAAGSLSFPPLLLTTTGGITITIYRGVYGVDTTAVAATKTWTEPSVKPKGLSFLHYYSSAVANRVGDTPQGNQTSLVDISNSNSPTAAIATGVGAYQVGGVSTIAYRWDWSASTVGNSFCVSGVIALWVSSGSLVLPPAPPIVVGTSTSIISSASGTIALPLEIAMGDLVMLAITPMNITLAYASLVAQGQAFGIFPQYSARIYQYWLTAADVDRGYLILRDPLTADLNAVVLMVFRRVFLVDDTYQVMGTATAIHMRGPGFIYMYSEAAQSGAVAVGSSRGLEYVSSVASGGGSAIAAGVQPHDAGDGGVALPWTWTNELISANGPYRVTGAIPLLSYITIPTPIELSASILGGAWLTGITHAAMSGALDIYAQIRPYQYQAQDGSWVSFGGSLRADLDIPNFWAVISGIGSMPVPPWNVSSPAMTMTVELSIGQGFVASLSDGGILRSSDGLRWERPLIDIFASSIVNDLIYVENHYVTVGQAGAISTSVDSLVWTPLTYVQFAPTALTAIAYGNGTYVVGGTGGYVAYSVDLVFWTKVDAGIGVSDVSTLVYEGGIFLVGAHNGLLCTSSDGIIWTLQTTYISSVPITAIAYGLGVFIAFTSDHELEISADGETWYTYTGLMPISGTVNAAIFNNGRFVAVGNSGLIITSSDGLNWLPHAEQIFNWMPYFSYANLYGIACSADGTFATVGTYYEGEFSNTYKSVSAASVDGIRWVESRGASGGMAGPPLIGQVLTSVTVPPYVDRALRMTADVHAFTPIRPNLMGGQVVTDLFLSAGVFGVATVVPFMNKLEANHSVLVYPGNLTRVPLLSPPVAVTVLASSSILGIQITDDPLFIQGITYLEIPLNQIPVTQYVALPLTLTDGTTYYWRVREYDTESVNWTVYSATWSFTPDVTVDSTGEQLFWSVVAGTPTPYLWSVHPERGFIGDMAVLTGTGFGLATGSVFIGSVGLTIVSWDLIPANGDAYTADRIIDPAQPVASPEHYEVTVILAEGDVEDDIIVVETA